MSTLTNKLKITLLLIIKLIFIKKCDGSCYFQSELQGFYQTQGIVYSNNTIDYTEIKILEDSIPLWGTCHEKIDNNFILKMGSNVIKCYKCFNVRLVTRNIVVVITKYNDFISRCFSNETQAKLSCPNITNSNINNYEYTETILYKKLDFDGLPIKLEYCPINGRYNFQYSNFEHNKTDHCTHATSTLDNCPSGSAINLRFHQCSFKDYEQTYECLGHWKGYNNQKYMALIDNRRKRNVPKYRCVNYEEKANGVMNLIFSKDSNCSAIGLDKNNNNSETMVLFPDEKFTWPHLNFCVLPSWLQGDWEHINVENETIIYRDQSSYKAYTMKCVEQTQDFNSTGNLILYSRSQCGEESYVCLKVKNRSVNIIEVKMGRHSSKDLTSNICDDDHFSNEPWLTQGRFKLQYEYLPCPVSGEFIGIIPDLPTLCTKLSSDCASEDIMYYKVTGCGFDEIYEERKYRCLGQWAEDNLVYTYVQRLDIDAYECFVGATSDGKRIYLKEAGQSCQRYLNPIQYGMEINKIGYCDDSKKSITYYDPYQGQLIKSGFKDIAIPNNEKDRFILSSISSVIPLLDEIEQNPNHHYDYASSDTISIPSDVVISKLSAKNKQLFEEHLLFLDPYYLETTTSYTKIIPLIPEIEAENEVDKPYDSDNKKNKKISQNTKNNLKCGSCKIALNAMLLSLAILFSG